MLVHRAFVWFRVAWLREAIECLTQLIADAIRAGAPEFGIK